MEWKEKNLDSVVENIWNLQIQDAKQWAKRTAKKAIKMIESQRKTPNCESSK